MKSFGWLACAVAALSGAMIARAAQDAALWPHLVAILWQGVWVALIIRIGVLLFRRHVLKSGGRWWKQLFRSSTG